LVQKRRLSRVAPAENFEIRRTSCSEWSRRAFPVPNLSLRQPDLAPSALVGPASIAAVLCVGLIGRLRRIHVVLIFVQVHRNLMIRRYIESLSPVLGPAQRGRVMGIPIYVAAPSIPHRVPSLVPVAVVSAALPQRHLDFTAPRIGFSISTLLQPVLQLTRTAVETEVNMLAHFLLYMLSVDMIIY
ncbi:hypothetical protein F5Y01DRAFT_327189, partial [Xylaria sp. FL0043]